MMTNDNFKSIHVGARERMEEADRQAKASMIAQFNARTVDSKSELEAGARAFKRAVQKIELHVERTDVDAAAFDYVGATQLLLEEFRPLSEAGAMGFLITVAQYLVDLKGAGEPVSDFRIEGVQRWIERSE